MCIGYSSDLILYVFVCMVCECGIGEDFIGFFFVLMWVDIVMDFGFVVYDVDVYVIYVYGFVEVVGLMCLQVFLCGVECMFEQFEMFWYGVSWFGVVFQNVNFLCDFVDDMDCLYCGYFGGIEWLMDVECDVWVEMIMQQFEDVCVVILLLFRDVCVVVCSVFVLFVVLI